MSEPSSRSQSQWVGPHRAEWKKPACSTIGDLYAWILAGPRRYLICIGGIGRKMAGEIDAELERLGVPVDIRHTLQFGREP